MRVAQPETGDCDGPGTSAPPATAASRQPNAIVSPRASQNLRLDRRDAVAGIRAAAGSRARAGQGCPAPASSVSEVCRIFRRANRGPATGTRRRCAFAAAQKAEQQQDLAQAEDGYRKAAQLDPSWFEAQYNYGVLAGRQRDFSHSLAAYEMALAIRPDSADARFNFALELKAAGYATDAENELNKIIAANPKEARAHLALANLYAQQMRDPARAREHYLKVLELDPRNPEAADIRFWLSRQSAVKNCWSFSAETLISPHDCRCHNPVRARQRAARSTRLTWWWWRCWGLGCFAAGATDCPRTCCRCLQWLVLVPVCAFGYQMVGGFLMNLAHLDKFWSLMDAYLALALVVFVIFSGIKPDVAEKLVKSNFFKGGEYYLGMVSGVVRYACVLVFLMALLNARFFTPAEIAAANAADKQSLGGGVFAGNYFPHLFTIQDWVFKQSFTGSCVKNEPPHAAHHPARPASAGEQRARAAEEDAGDPDRQSADRARSTNQSAPKIGGAASSAWPAFLPQPSNASAPPATSWTSSARICP